MKIIYQNTEGGVSVITPTQEALDSYSLDAIARKDVPAGLAYKIINETELPSDRSFRGAWEADITNPDGIGAESNQFVDVERTVSNSLGAELKQIMEVV